ncbi:hypothetical protein C5167_047561 [Papaver somniferum]|uniref:Uncharacterized protein n=1 Tax=Papaver somniferum TaxID=3469 RepID=A0A4Y7LHQ4_PAPSO|nr:protein ENHANCED PSEUDOMONAS SUSCEPTIBILTY 1-like [Papaver somniferum]RZC84776.1 hypothetical protein C5167_047561 [Papaver somniferum]
MSSAEVRHVSTTKVRPASCIDGSTKNHRRIDLNPVDLAFLRIAYMQKGLLFSNDEKCIIEKISNLKTSLSRTLDDFFPLAGRLAVENHEDDNTISVYINCNFEGVDFIHATADISVEDIVSPTYVPQSLIDPLFSLTGVPNYKGQSHPLLSVQVTELRDGAVFIGCSANHSVCDGTSFWHFINSWSEIARSADNHVSSPSPVFERWFIRETDCPIRLPFSLADKLSTAVGDSNTTEVSPLEGLVEKCFHFTKANIAALKARVNSEMVISSLQALLAHVWTAVIRCRSSLNDNYDDSRVLPVMLLMNNRTKLIPPLPETYFGNSLVVGLVTLKEGELIKKGSGVLASLLKEMVNSNNFEKSRSFIESWMEKPITPGPGGDVPEIFRNMFVARSSQWFNMYGNDFGWGRPIAVKTGRNGKNYGTTTVSPGPVEGSVDIEICLPVEVFKAMENDAEFMEAFSS